MLEQVYLHRWQVELLVKELICFHNQVVFRFSFYFQSGLVQAELSSAFVQDVYFQCVFYGNRVEHSLQVVISVGTLLYDVQSQVYLGIRKCYHSF